MDGIWTRYLAERERHDACDKAKYLLLQRRHAARIKATAAIAAADLPKEGLLAFSPERLMREGDRFVLVRLSANRAGGGDLLSIDTITLKRPEDADGEPTGGMRAVGDDGRDRGHVTRATFERQTTFTNPDRSAWNDPRFHGRFDMGSVLLPLDAEIDDHPAGARMKALAHRVHMTKLVMEDSPMPVAYLDELLQLAAVDDRIADEDLEMGFIRTNVSGAIDVAAKDAGFSLDALDPGLVRDLRTMDWTHEYADRTVPGAHAQERRIRKALGAMAIGEALMAMHGTSTTWFHHARSYLRDHPEAKAAAKTGLPGKAAA